MHKSCKLIKDLNLPISEKDSIILSDISQFIAQYDNNVLNSTNDITVSLNSSSISLIEQVKANQSKEEKTKKRNQQKKQEHLINLTEQVNKKLQMETEKVPNYKSFLDDMGKESKQNNKTVLNKQIIESKLQENTKINQNNYESIIKSEMEQNNLEISKTEQKLKEIQDFNLKLDNYKNSLYGDKPNAKAFENDSFDNIQDKYQANNNIKSLSQDYFYNTNYRSTQDKYSLNKKINNSKKPIEQRYNSSRHRNNSINQSQSSDSTSLTPVNKTDQLYSYTNNTNHLSYNNYKKSHLDKPKTQLNVKSKYA